MLKIAHAKMPILFIVLKCENEILNATEASIDDFSWLSCSRNFIGNYMPIIISCQFY